MTPLPFVVEPRPQEAIDGYFDRVSAATGWPLAAVLDAVGGRRHTGQAPTVIRLSDRTAQIMGDRLRIAQRTLHNMTVAGHFMWTQPSSATWDASRARAAASKNWFFIAGSRYCPLCVAGGLWDIRWRSALSVVCPTHDALLVDECPQCGGWPRSDRRGVAENVRVWPRPSDPRACSRHVGSRAMGRASSRCMADLAQAAARPAGTRLRESQRLAAAVSHGERPILGREASPREAHRVLLALTALLMYDADRATAWPRQSPPRRTGLVAAALPDALEVCTAADAEDSAAVLREALRQRQVPVDRQHLRNPTSAAVEDLFDRVLRHSGRLSTRLSRSATQVLPLYPTHSAQIPQLFWRCALPPELTEKPGKPSVQMRAAFMSLSAARILTGTWEEAAEALELPTGAGRRWSRYVIEHLADDARVAVANYAISVLPLIASGPRQERASIRHARDLGAVPWPHGHEDIKAWCPCVAAPKS